MKKAVFLFLLLVIVILTGCSQTEETAEAAVEDPAQETMAMLSGTAAESTVVLPDFLEGYPELVKENYALSYEYADVLKWMPCFCGCGENKGHESNYNCFIQHHEGREVTWDTMGLNCDICNNIARESIALYEEDYFLYEIRTYIDNKYGSYGPSTDTPVPEKTA